MYIHGERRQNYVRTIHAISRIVSRALSGGFNRGECLPLIQEMVNSTSSVANDTSFFWQDNLGRIWSNILNPIITQRACINNCGGNGMGWYPDAITRLLTWFVPGIFLISSINLPPIGGKRFFMVAHLFGDPIHSYWSLLSKLEEWNECYTTALALHRHTQRPASELLQFVFPLNASPIDKEARDTAVVIAAIKELLPSDSRIDITSIRYCSCFSHEASNIHNRLAGSIIDARISGNTTTWFAISTYIFGIICAFISKLGGSTGPSGPSGGRIAPAMLLSWLLPSILLNNAVGQFRREDCIRVVRKLEEEVKALEGPHLRDCGRNPSSLHQDWTADPRELYWNVLLDSQAWSGGIYSCQALKPMFEDGDRKWRSRALVVVAVASISVSFSIAFRVLYSFPTFFSCRNIMFVGIMLVWLLSPFITRGIMTNTSLGNLKSRWKILVFKDGFIGLAILVSLVASSCGLGNSCRCWAGFFNKIKGVVLNPDAQFTKNNTYIYPILIATCLVGQYLVFKTGLYIGRRGLRIMNWSEKDRRASLPRRAVRQNVDAGTDAVDLALDGQSIEGKNKTRYELIDFGGWDFDL